MKITPANLNVFRRAVSLLFILLFVYASVSKLLDFENFQVQLGQSPLISAFAGWLAWSVPLSEFLISVLLAIGVTRIAGLILSLGMMALFSTYIFMMLHFSPYVPCSCGGILEGMGWEDHLYFNLFFVALAVIALMFCGSRITVILRIALPVCAGVLTVYGLYLLSEDTMARENPFIRRFVPVSIGEPIREKLPNPNFYFSGKDSAKVYLGNLDSPLHFLEYDSALHRRFHSIRLSADNYRFSSLTLHVAPPYFYLMDGSVPIIYKGSLSSGSASPVYRGPRGFTKAAVLGKQSFALRGQRPASGEHLMLYLGSGKDQRLSPRDTFLEKQLDGIFDTEGMLEYSTGLHRFVYTYYYRNEFIVSDSSLNVLFRGKTIDTVSKADLKIVKVQKTGDVKLAEPPLTVNKNTAVYGNLLFVRSGLRGRYESIEAWRQSSVIDIYDIRKNSYVSSFYVYHQQGKPFAHFTVNPKGFYTITGNTLTRYSWGKPIWRILTMENESNSKPTGR